MPREVALPATVEVQSIAPGGNGVARLETGETVFVPQAAPGDRAELRKLRRNQGVLHAEEFVVVKAGPDRVVAPCPYAEACGGCDFMHLDLPAQQRAKQSMLADALQRTAGLPDAAKRITWVPCKQALGYRTRVRLHVGKDGRVGYVSARSTRLVPIARCIVASTRLNALIEGLSVLPAPQAKKLSFCEQLELRESAESEAIAVRLTPRKGVKLRADVYTELFPAGTVIVIAETPEDKEHSLPVKVTERVTLQIPLGAFAQVNPTINRELVAGVVAGATLRQHKTFLDAYAGAGNFALPLLTEGLTGEAIDETESAILAARRVARQLGLPLTGFSIGDSKRLLELFVKNRRQFDYVVLDPPRKGSKDILSQVLKLKPRTVALIGCDPVSLARDLGQLVAAGATLESLTVYDMFPQTHHLETLALVDASHL